MGLRVRTSTASLNAQRHMAERSELQRNTLSTLASLRSLPGSGHNAASFALVAEYLCANLSSYSVAQRRAHQHSSKAAAFSAQDTQNILLKLRDLANSATFTKHKPLSLAQVKEASPSNSSSELKHFVNQLFQSEAHDPFEDGSQH